MQPNNKHICHDYIKQFELPTSMVDVNIFRLSSFLNIMSKSISMRNLALWVILKLKFNVWIFRNRRVHVGLKKKDLDCENKWKQREFLFVRTMGMTAPKTNNDCARNGYWFTNFAPAKHWSISINRSFI